MRIVQAEMKKMTFAEYRKVDAYNWSSFKHALIAPSFARYKRENPTDGSKVGRLVHCLTLDPGSFDGEFVVSEFENFRTKAAQEWRDTQTKDIVTAADMAQCSNLAGGVLASKFGRALLANAETEMSIIANVEDGDRTFKVKGRLDFFRWIGESVIAGDLKTTSALTGEEFCRVELFKHHYAGQAAYYSELLASCGLEVKEWNWLCVNENTGDVFAVRASDELLVVGGNIWRKALHSYDEGIFSGVWRGAAENEMPVVANVPDWYADKFGGEV